MSTAWRKVAGGLLAVCWTALLLATLLAGCDAKRDAAETAAGAATVQQDAGGNSAPAQAGADGGQLNRDAENATREGGVVFEGDSVILTLDAETLESLGGGPEDFTGAGFEKVEATPGGGVALTMTADYYAQMMDELRQGIMDALAAIVADGGEYPSIKDIEANEDFTAFTLTVEREPYEEGTESLVEMLLGMYSVSWQVYAGGTPRPPAFVLVDEATGTAYESFTLAGEGE